MSDFQSQPGRRIISWQLFLTVLTAAVLLILSDLVTAYSALTGGMISVIANAFFAFRLFSNKTGWQADRVASSVYRGVLGRFFLTVAMFFMVVVMLKPLNVTALFAVYLLVQVSPALLAGVLNRV